MKRYTGCHYVSAYFNDSQRQATKDAAGWRPEVLRIIMSQLLLPSYGMDKIRQSLFLTLAAAFDISILDLGDGVFE